MLRVLESDNGENSRKGFLDMSARLCIIGPQSLQADHEPSSFSIIRSYRGDRMQSGLTAEIAEHAEGSVLCAFFPGEAQSMPVFGVEDSTRLTACPAGCIGLYKPFFVSAVSAISAVSYCF